MTDHIKTPLTDARISAINDGHAATSTNDFDHYFDMSGQLADHARDLERDRARLVAALREVTTLLDTQYESCKLSCDYAAVDMANTLLRDLGEL